MSPAAKRVLAVALEQSDDVDMPTEGWEHYASAMTDRGGVFYFDHPFGWRLRVDTTAVGQIASFEAPELDEAAWRGAAS